VDEKVASGLSPNARDNWTPAAGLVLWSNERPSDILSGVPGAEPFHFLLSPFPLPLPLPPEDRKQQDVGCGVGVASCANVCTSAYARLYPLSWWLVAGCHRADSWLARLHVQN